MKLKKLKKPLCWLLMMALLLPLASLQAKAETVIGRADHQIVEAPDYTRPNPPEINSDTAIVIELNSGVMLYAKDIHRRMYPASITKIITALIALEQCKLDETLVLSHNSVTDLVEGGEDARRRFYEGQSFSIEEAVYALSLNSVNTVGYALAEHIDGSLDAFSERMNARARELGAINTTFHNPHGLNDLLHMTTAYDMAMIMWGAIQNDLYRKISGTRSFSFTDNNGNIITCDHNYLVFQPDSDYYDPRIVAGKTGWVEEAEYTRTVYASDGNLDVICVTFHADTTHNAYQDVRALLDYAFDNFSLVSIPSFGQDGLISADVQDDKTGEECTLRFRAGEPRTATGAALLVPKDYIQKEWRRELVPAEEGLKAVASLGNVPLVTYPLTTTIERKSAPMPTHLQPEPSAMVSQDASTLPVPGTTVKDDSTSTARPSSQASSTTAVRSTETEPSRTGSGWNTALLIIMGVLLLLSLAFGGLMAYQNKILKARVCRRQALKRDR